MAAMLHRRSSISMLLILAGFFLVACSSYSKEQEREMQRIRDMVTADPTSANRPDSGGITPLQYAVLNNYRPLMDWLHDHGADPNARGRDGETPLHTAIISDHSPDHRVLRALLETGADVNAGNNYGDTPLHRAAYLGTTDKVRFLVSNKADVERRAQRGETPLLYASRPEGHPEAVLALLEGGANVNAADNFGMTPLHGAAMIGAVEVARVLVEKGEAGINIQTTAGYTPLHVAALFGQTDFVRYLLEKGANPSLRDKDNLTPAERASRFPAVSSSNTGSHPVDTAAAVNLLRTSTPQ